jgi:hypothetical protein
MEGAPLKEDAGWEDYDLGLQLLSPAGILTAGTGDTRGVTIGSPEWQLRESHSLKKTLSSDPTSPTIFIIITPPSPNFDSILLGNGTWETLNFFIRASLPTPSTTPGYRRHSLPSATAARREGADIGGLVRLRHGRIRIRIRGQGC